VTRSSSADEIANVNFLRRHRTRTTKYNRLDAHEFLHNVNQKPSINTRKATVKRNSDNKLKSSNAVSKLCVHPQMRAFSYACKLTARALCDRIRLLISKFNARGSGYVLERRNACLPISVK